MCPFCVSTAALVIGGFGSTAATAVTVHKIPALRRMLARLNTLLAKEKKS